MGQRYGPLGKGEDGGVFFPWTVGVRKVPGEGGDFPPV